MSIYALILGYAILEKMTEAFRVYRQQVFLYRHVCDIWQCIPPSGNTGFLSKLTQQISCGQHFIHSVLFTFLSA